MARREKSMRRYDVRRIALVAIMAAVVCVLTAVPRVPVPATGGYVHLGDVGAAFAALAFGPSLGFLISGGGMAVADVIGGYALYAPGTFVIHGLQAVVIALLGQRRSAWLMFVAAAAGGVIVVGGYFLYQWLILGMAMTVALVEVPFNMLQASVGLLGVPLYLLVRRAYPPLVRWAQPN
jgi:uncharacterized membrane protein